MNKRLLFFLFTILTFPLLAQYTTVSGTVYDMSGRIPLEQVVVLSTSGKGTITDSLGKYSLTLHKTDSIWFRFSNRNTKKHAVDTMSERTQFDISLYVRANMLPEVRVQNNSYRVDSIQNRREYQKYFDFQKPGLSINTSPGSTTTPGVVGLDINELINMFRFKRNRNLQFLQNRLLSQEQEKYVNYRFNKKFISKITKLHGSDLDSFIRYCRPDYDLVKNLNDLELGYYTQEVFKQYKIAKQKGYLRRKEF